MGKENTALKVLMEYHVKQTQVIVYYYFLEKLDFLGTIKYYFRKHTMRGAS